MVYLSLSWCVSFLKNIPYPQKVKLEFPLILRYATTVFINTHASVLKRSTRADCKSAGISLRRFESLPAHHTREKNRVLFRIRFFSRYGAGTYRTRRVLVHVAHYLIHSSRKISSEYIQDMVFHGMVQARTVLEEFWYVPHILFILYFFFT